VAEPLKKEKSQKISVPALFFDQSHTPAGCVIVNCSENDPRRLLHPR